LSLGFVEEMKLRLVSICFALLLVFAATSQAGRWCGPGWGYGGWGGPAFGISFIAPIPVYRTVYVARPAPYYTERVVRVSRPASQLVRAQNQLASLGYYRGYADGVFGPLTSRAIVQYQSDNGLRVTGRLDRATLRSLGV
jgi:Putative peptidoglycan binding domain